MTDPIPKLPPAPIPREHRTTVPAKRIAETVYECERCEDGGLVERTDAGGYYEAPCPSCAEREYQRHLEGL